MADTEPLTLAKWVAGIVLRWRLAVATALVVLALVALSLVFQRASYRARASFVANPSATSRLTGAIGSSAPGLGGLATQLGLPTMADPSESPGFYNQLLHSRELLTRLLLLRLPNPRTAVPNDSATFLAILDISGRDERRKLETALKRLDKQLRTDFDPKTAIVQLRIDTEWPDLSAGVLNRAVELVAAFNREQRSSTVRTKRLYLDDRLAESRLDLERSEQRLRSFYEQNRLWRNSPGLLFEEQQLRRRVDIAGDLYLALQRQYDAARLEELNNAALITVIDSAVVPRKAQWPRFGALLVTVLIVGGLVGLFVAGAAAVVDDWRLRNPDGARSFGDALSRARNEIGSTLRGRRLSRRRAPKRVA